MPAGPHIAPRDSFVNGTPTDADWVDLLRNTAVAVPGNVAGGVILVAFVRSVQAQASHGP